MDLEVVYLEVVDRAGLDLEDMEVVISRELCKFKNKSLKFH